MIIDDDDDDAFESSPSDFIRGSLRSLLDAFSIGSLRPYVSRARLHFAFSCVLLATNYNDSAPYKKSVEDVSEETRYILEEFIIERATEDGVDMGLVRPIIDVDLAARKHRHTSVRERENDT